MQCLVTFSGRLKTTALFLTISKSPDITFSELYFKQKRKQIKNTSGSAHSSRICLSNTFCTKKFLKPWVSPDIFVSSRSWWIAIQRCFCLWATEQTSDFLTQTSGMEHWLWQKSIKNERKGSERLEDVMMNDDLTTLPSVPLLSLTGHVDLT